MTLRALDPARLSGPGLRTFERICDQWSLSSDRRAAVLGAAPVQYDAWVAVAHRREDFELPESTLIRISAVLSIYKNLRTVLPHEEHATAWMTRPHRGVEFGGRAPIERLIDVEGTDVLLSYLLAWGAGNLPARAPEGTYEPVTEDDVVLLDRER